MCYYCPRDPNFTPFGSTASRFQDIAHFINSLVPAGHRVDPVEVSCLVISVNHRVATTYMYQLEQQIVCRGKILGKRNVCKCIP